MKRDRWVSLPAVLILVAILLGGCGEGADVEVPGLGSYVNAESNAPYRTVTGKTTGTINVVYSYNNQTVTCTDEAASYELTILEGGTALPEGTHLSSDSIPSTLRYFRLDVIGVERILMDDQCLIRDPSDDMVHTLIEGTYDGSDLKFTVLSCSTYGAPSSADIYYPDKDIVNGQVTCQSSDQKKKVYSFSGLALH